MNSQADDYDDKSWLRVPLTDPVAVAERYDEWAPSYDDELRAWGYEAPVQAARLLVAQLRGRPHVRGQVALGQEGSEGDVAIGVGVVNVADIADIADIAPVTGAAGGDGVDGVTGADDVLTDGAVFDGAVLDIGCGRGLRDWRCSHLG